MNSTLLLKNNRTTFFQKTTAILSVVLVGMMLLLSTNTKAQVQDYTYLEFNGVVDGEVYTPITGTDLFGPTVYQQFTPIGSEIPLGFTFVYNGAPKTEVKIHSNGFIYFDGAFNPAATMGDPISTTLTNRFSGAIAGYARANLVYASFGSTPIYPAVVSSVEYQTTGAVGSRVFTVQFKNMARYSVLTSPREGLVNFQIKLYEGSNIVEVIHDVQPTALSVPANLLGQCGLRGTSNADRNNRAANAVAYTNTIAGTAANSGLNYRNISHLGTVIRMQWTPPCLPPTAPAAINLTGTTADISWTAPAVAPASYDFEVRTSGAPGSGFAGLGASGNVAATSTTATGLTEGFTYTLYVRSNCGGSPSTWVTGPTFTLPCAATTVPYFLTFDPITDGFAVPGLPVCTDNDNAGLGNNWVTTGADFGAGYFDEHLTYVFNANDANTWFITKPVAMTAGTTYRLQYLYGGSSEFSFITNRLDVRYGTVGSAAGLAGAIQLDNHPEIKSSPESNIVHFTAPTTDAYYFGFHAYSDASNGSMYLDDVFVDFSSCFVPTGLTAPAVLVSFNNATITWTAPSPSPTGGYAYYYNTTGVPPTNGTPPSGVVPAGTTLTVIPSLSPNTNYFVWVRSSCGPGEFGEWSTNTTFTTLPAPPVYCGGAVPSGASFAQDPNGIINFTMGSINNTTGTELPDYYGDYSGLTANLAQGATVPVSITFGTGWTYDTIIWVDWNNDGDFNDAGEQVFSGTSAAPNPSTLSGSFVVPIGQPLGPVRLRIGSIDSPFFAGGALTPCRNGAYQSFEDYTINVIVAPPLLTLSQTTMSAQCGLTDSPVVTITSTISDYDVYTWTPSAGVSGDQFTGYTFNTSATTTYILNASQTSGVFSTNTATFTYVANETPTPITITTPDGTDSCVNGPAIELNAGGGIVSNVTVFQENFNSGIDGPPDLVVVPPVLQFKSRISSSGGSNPAASAWTVRPNGYVPPPLWFGAINSNDNTNFVFTNSDAQGSGGGSVTRTRLISPPIDLTSYSAATLNFYHFYRYFNANDFAFVQVAIDPANLATFPEGSDPESAALTWVNLAQYTSTQGTASNFAQAFLNLNPYVGNVIRIRYNFQSNWGWGWAIDNFRILGSANSDVVWTPATGLYTDAAATIPYVAGTGTSVVYAMPGTDTVYTATATAPGPTFCESTQTVAITVIPQEGGTLSADQASCDTTSFTPITLSGHVGDVQGWEYADDAAFTVGVTAIANTTTTLTPAEFGTFPIIRYFRAVVGTGSCNPVYSAVASVSTNATILTGTTTWSNGLPDISKRVIIAGDYTALTNFSACSVQVLTGATLLVQSGVTVTVENEFIVDGPSLPNTVVFENNASLIQLTDAANAGAIRYERNTTPIVQYDYTYWSSPVAGQVLGSLSPDTNAARFYVFNNATYSWQNISNAAAMDAARGYIIRAPGTFSTTVPAVFTGAFLGVPHNGPYAPTITVAGVQNRNLLGNPYPSAIDADLLYAANNSVLQGNFFFWTHNTPITANLYNANDYATYNATGGTGTAATTTGVNTTVPNGNIAAGQGFFVQGLASGTVNFTNAMRLVGLNDVFYRSSDAPQINAVEKHRIWLNIINQQGAYKQMLLGYVQGATNAIDNGYDADVTEAGNVVSLYSLNSNKKLTIQGRALPFDINDEVPLGFRTTIPGNFAIELENFDGLFEEGQTIYLEDKWLNVIHNLNESNYNFTTEIGTFDDRFEVQFVNGTLSLDNPADASNAVIVYKNNETIFINSGVMLMKEVKIVDMRGRLVAQKNNINATDVNFSHLNAAQQVLLVQITIEDGELVTKRVVY